MKHLVLTIFDLKAKAYLQPFMSQTLGTAIRQITDCLTDANHQFAKHPQDYTLFHIYDFDDTTAIYTPVPDQAPIKLIELLATATAHQTPPENKLTQMSDQEVLEDFQQSRQANGNTDQPQKRT